MIYAMKGLFQDFRLQGLRATLGGGTPRITELWFLDDKFFCFFLGAILIVEFNDFKMPDVTKLRFLIVLQYLLTK